MPDSKITALTSISTSTDPANDPLVIVDVSDTSMAATGTTKKVTLNQLLGASGTATLASATISGDLTVDTSTLVVNSSQNRVGIGFSGNASSGRLQISQPLGSTIDGALRITDDATTSFVFNNVSSGVSGIWSSGAIAFGVGSGTFTEAMRLNSTGLGVGVSPSYKLDIFGTVRIGTANPIVRLETGTNTGFIDYNDTRLQLHAGPLPMYFVTGSTLRMTLDATGNLGIGVTPSAWASNRRALQVGGLAAAALALNGTSNVSEMFFNSFVNTSASNVYAVNGRAGLIDFGSGGFGFSIDSGTQTAGAACNFTRAMTLDASGRLLVGPTSANTSGGVLQLSSGITFPATQVASSDANTLDDYEEGTFTPGITFGGASVGMTGTFAGRYTKVGRAVTINGIIALTAKGSSTGIAKIAGLPFTSANASGEYTAISIRLDRVSFADYPCGYVGPNSSVVELENTTNAGTVSSMTDSNFINTSVVIVNFTYTV